MRRDLRTRRWWGCPASSPSARLPLSILLLLSQAAAHPYPKDDLHDSGLGFLMPRDCVQYCGYDNQYCCGSGQQCYTSNDIAGCRNTAAGGGYNFYTTTWTLTETFTSTYSSYYPAATTAAYATCVPEAGTGQIACGSICCANWQYCAYEGQCMSNPGVVATTTTDVAKPTTSTTMYTTYTSSGVVVTTTYGAPYRVTGTGTATTGFVVGETGTGNSTSSSSSSLSGGAIAGIVIGSLAGVVLLISICACILVRGLLHGVLSLLGIRKKREREEDITIIEEERYRRRGGGQHGSWYGGRPPPPPSEKKKSSGPGLLGMGAIFGTLLLLLGLRRSDRKDSRHPPRTRSDVSSSFYSRSFSSRSSDPSSRGTRHSRGTRATRRTDPSRVTRASRPSRQRRFSRD